MKRIFDIILVMLAAPLWLPLSGIVALVVFVAEGRPLFFRQVRIGKDERAFVLVKFRSMRLAPGSDAERLTRFGRWLRRTSLDELPELWNVLKGEMSLVGPRPLPVCYLPRYEPWQRRRHEVRPGITGWAQVNGRNALGWDARFRLDVDYVERRSLAFDAWILLLTIGVVLRSRDVSFAGAATMPEFHGKNMV